LVGLTKKENTHQGPGSIARPLFRCWHGLIRAAALGQGEPGFCPPKFTGK